ncbi:hypothetical protein GQ53DRAFT_202068 [Thozetella sp. PMI_491]|nr:hypothetical protein GQ53DRAFT_202068 [Thozetella sp. PMI_491]
MGHPCVAQLRHRAATGREDFSGWPILSGGAPTPEHENKSTGNRGHAPCRPQHVLVPDCLVLPAMPASRAAGSISVSRARKHRIHPDVLTSLLARHLAPAWPVANCRGAHCEVSSRVPLLGQRGDPMLACGFPPILMRSPSWKAVALPTLCRRASGSEDCG